jgi:type II secretory pathway pseudopilin PulG
MSTNRLFTLLIILALALVAALSARTLIGKGGSASEMDSATRSYIAWGEALKVANKEGVMVPVTGDNITVDASFRTFIGWVDACGVDISYANNVELDSATRSYIGWGLSMPCGYTP